MTACGIYVGELPGIGVLTPQQVANEFRGLEHLGDAIWDEHPEVDEVYVELPGYTYEKVAWREPAPIKPTIQEVEPKDDHIVPGEARLVKLNVFVETVPKWSIGPTELGEIVEKAVHEALKFNIHHTDDEVTMEVTKVCTVQV